MIRWSLTALLAIALAGNTLATPAVTTEDFELSENELRYLVKTAPREVAHQIQEDKGALYEYLRQVMQRKALAKAALDVAPDSEAYFEAYYTQLNALTRLERQRVVSRIEVPELERLARERYQVEQERYGRVPERREFSHILLLCQGDCDETAVRADLTLIRDQLVAGESFEDLARGVSDDVASARRGGRLSGGVYQDATNVDKAFLEAGFDLVDVGELSPIVRSQFGFHIIRLEAVEETYLRAFEDAREAIEKDIRSEYIGLATEEALKAYFPDDDMRIDGPTVDRILGEPR